MKGSDILVDLAGTSGQVDWGGNVVFNFTYAYVFMAVKSMLDPDLPNNDGSSAPIGLEAPEGTVVNCTFPAAVAARMQIVDGAVGMVQMALEQLERDRVVDLDEERKAAMVSNLLVVLCGEENARPVLNAGTLHN